MDSETEATVLSETEAKVLEVANDVYAVLRGGHDESVYQQAMAYEFRLWNLSYRVEATAEVLYKNKQRVGTRRLDIVMVAENETVIELKATGKIGPKDRAQLRAYLRTVGQESGLLINFPFDDADTVEHERISV